MPHGGTSPDSPDEFVIKNKEQRISPIYCFQCGSLFHKSRRDFDDVYFKRSALTSPASSLCRSGDRSSLRRLALGNERRPTATRTTVRWERDASFMTSPPSNANNGQRRREQQNKTAQFRERKGNYIRRQLPRGGTGPGAGGRGGCGTFPLR